MRLSECAVMHLAPVFRKFYLFLLLHLGSPCYVLYSFSLAAPNSFAKYFSVGYAELHSVTSGVCFASYSMYLNIRTKKNGSKATYLQRQYTR